MTTEVEIVICSARGRIGTQAPGMSVAGLQPAILVPQFTQGDALGYSVSALQAVF